MSSTERVHGVAIGLGIQLSEAGNCLVMTEGDFERIKSVIENARRRREPATAS